jgi:hypothetical protein
MKRILNETDEARFIELTNKYFEELQTANEVEFLNYLVKYVCFHKIMLHPYLL